MLIGTITLLGLFIVTGGVSLVNIARYDRGHDAFSLVMSVAGVCVAVAQLVQVASA